MDKRTASSLPFRFATAVFALLCVGVVSLEQHLPRTQRNYLTTIMIIVLECRRMLESFYAVSYFKQASEA